MKSKILRRLRLWLLSMFFTSVASFGASSEPSGVGPCGEMERLVLNATWRSQRVAQAGFPRQFHLTVPRPGILALDLGTLAAESQQPRLRFSRISPGEQGPPRIDRSPEGFRRLHATPASLLLDIQQAGTYFVAVEAGDSSGPVPPYRIRTVFASPFRAQTETDSRNRWSWIKDCQEGEDVPVCQPEWFRLAGLSPEEKRAVFSLCSLGEVDDHGETPLCATPLIPGKTVVGRIANKAGDDEDLFTFVLGDPGKVRVELDGGFKTSAFLYDDRRQRLGTESLQKSDDSGGFLATLSPGRYFLKFRGCQGSDYSFRVELEEPAVSQLDRH